MTQRWWQRLLPWTRKASRGRPPQPLGPAGLPSYIASGAALGGRRFVAPEGKSNLALYRDMRCCFPVLDVAISKLVRLCGSIEVEADERTKGELEDWLRSVRANALGRGFQVWLEVHLDQMLQYGRAVGELVPTRGRTEVYALTNLDPFSIAFLTVPDDPLSLAVVQVQGGRTVEIPPAYALVSAHNPQGDNPHGVSLYRSLPLVAEALSVIENATVQVWQRHGAPPFHVNWTPPENFQDPDGTLTQRFMANIQSAFVGAMEARGSGKVQDFFSSGKVAVDVIGAAGAVLELQEPFRAFAEQVVAATGLPSWMFGFHWSSTERLSTQQADMLLAHVEGIRRTVQPVVERVIETRQRLRGYPAPRAIRWSAITLRDLTEQSRGEAWAGQATARKIENARRMWELGFWTQLQAARAIDPTLRRAATPYDTPPAPGERQPIALSPNAN